jgi:colanic acid/amylovoran biosynthesis glycosyltransferase
VASLTVNSAYVPQDTSLLLDLGVPFQMVGNNVQIEAQAYNGLLRWLDNFDRITVCAPLLPNGQTESSMRWTPVAPLLAEGRLRVMPFPWGYDISAHAHNVGAVRRALRTLIPQHRYLCFSNLGWLGAWGRIACEEAYRSDRPYAVWLDWVLHEMPIGQESNPVIRIWRRLQHAMLKKKSLRDIRRASLGLFHGKTVFDGYSSLCKVSRIVHDVHLGVRDIISVEQMKARLERKVSSRKIIYVGRVHPMKGPWEWLDAVQRILSVSRDRCDVKAVWIGDGPLLEEMREAVEARDLAARVSFPGAEMDRDKLLATMRDADVFVFCHLSPESPRCLIEALMSGLPIFGFESAYASDILNGSSGGELVPLNDTVALSEAVLRCINDPAATRTMSEAARATGTHFSDVAVFRHRSELIKELL